MYTECNVYTECIFNQERFTGQDDGAGNHGYKQKHRQPNSISLHFSC